MFFELSTEQLKLCDTARQFADDNLYPLAESVKGATYPFGRAMLARPAFAKAAAAGFFERLIPAPFGGSATSGVDTAIFTEEFACGSPDFTISFAISILAGVEWYNPQIALIGNPDDPLTYSVIEGSDTDVRQCRMHGVMRTSEWDPLCLRVDMSSADYALAS